jgi:hypothetical protein
MLDISSKPEMQMTTAFLRRQTGHIDRAARLGGSRVRILNADSNDGVFSRLWNYPEI